MAKRKEKEMATRDPSSSLNNQQTLVRNEKEIVCWIKDSLVKTGLLSKKFLLWAGLI